MQKTTENINESDDLSVLFSLFAQQNFFNCDSIAWIIICGNASIIIYVFNCWTMQTDLKENKFYLSSLNNLLWEW